MIALAVAEGGLAMIATVAATGIPLASPAMQPITDGALP